MTTPTRQTIFQMAARKLRQEFQELRVIPHSGAKGGEAERLVRRFLDGHLPRRFAAGAGFIIDQQDHVSKQSDVVIYDAMNCPIYRASDEAAIFPADNVAAVVEVKSRLDGDRLAEAYENIRAAKRLVKTREPDVPFLVQTQTLGCVFAFESAVTLEKLKEHYKELLSGNSLRDHIDLIIVLDRGMIMLSVKVPSHSGWHPCLFAGPGGVSGEGAHLALSSQALGEDTLDAFLRMLLVHLSFFRSAVDHPGFNWRAMASGGETHFTYLTSITHEQDPERREQNLNAYKEQVVQEFSAMNAARQTIP